jgi:ribose 5-phosphate isomerase RpiB
MHRRDHGGYPLNERVIEELRHAGHDLIDFGTHDGSIPDDYPDYANKSAKRCKITRESASVCGSGVGAAVALTS